ncbi:hypothetical protein FIA58_000915 [Flavobacterium jejuense]|uniref:Cytochrome c domain-containing protein n=1 Tax=Flavobacterium jejuense TaxID=1544455 RepID=A0ABX0IK75_9FLAO|nr:hypothetical protein [Flavobacterium jejuense]NHN24224.1 hypothetical protein [Flavobacterium jejuense]
MKKYLLLVVITFYIGCNQKNENNDMPNEKEAFDMYEFSQMAGLMEQMYAENKKIKESIEKGESIGEFPEYFSTIYEAELTDKKDRDSFFNQQARIFIEAQQLIYENDENVKDHFNLAIDACIQCHQQKCLGPIPRIKKLYIK